MSEDGQVGETRRGIALERKARRILGVDADAGEDEIKKAFWRLAMENHPDKFPGDREREKRFLALLAAYEYLVKEGAGDDLPRARGEYRPPDDVGENPWKYFAWWREQFY